MLRIIKLSAVAISAVTVLFLTAAAAFAAVVLVSAGLISVVVSAGCLTGVLGNVASDLAPQAMLFTGLFCVFLALSLATALYLLCPRAARRFNKAMESRFP